MAALLAGILNLRGRASGRRALLLLLAAAGCAVLPSADDVPTEAGAFLMSGRLGVRAGEEGFTGNLRWLHAQRADRVWIRSPLGQTVAYIERDAGGVTLQTADGQEFHASSAEALTRDALGWTLPVSGLSYWVAGVPDPSSAAQVEQDAEGRVTRLAQDGWSIGYVWNDDATPARPRRVEARRGDLVIRLTVDEWQGGGGRR